MRKSQAQLVGVMIAVAVFIMVVEFIPALKDSIDRSRGSTYLDCTNTTISVGEKVTCLIVDFSLPYYFGMGLAVAGAALGGFWLMRKKEGG